ncbi:MAG: hypothetical protein DI616_02915 [Paracoccus denitrificans]|uniref:Uncharacterized protein n=1 Tax=Paracoccus denitrificans TaxID=266 RepID=A0A533IC95_PARDE|nr:MAG: hypothetical protein DI616_02915 [Paracoccus denitrificans]
MVYEHPLPLTKPAVPSRLAQPDLDWADRSSACAQSDHVNAAHLAEIAEGLFELKAINSATASG